MPRILLITQSLPWPLRRNGGAQRTELLRRALAQLGEVDIVGVGGDERLGSPDEQRQMRELNVVKHFDVMSGPRPTIRAPWPIKSILFQREDWARRYRPDRRIVDWLIEQQRGPHPYDVIVARYLKAAAKAGLTDGVDRYRVPVVLDFDDIDHELFRSQREADPWPGLGGRIAMRMIERQLARVALRAPRHVAATWVCSEEDATLFDAGRGMRVLPNIPFDEQVEPLPPNAQSQTILFVGDLTYPSNRAGVVRFVREVWPRIRETKPDARLELVGKMSPQDVAGAFAVPGVQALGYVDVLRDAYQRCAFTVAPIWTGGGTKIKVIESIAMGRPCATTTHCLRGYGPLVRGDVLRGDDDAAALAARCIAWLDAPQTVAALAERGVALARAAYSFDAFARTVEQTIRPLLRPATTSAGSTQKQFVAGGTS